MKKTLTLILLIIPFLIFSQTTNNRKAIKKTIGEIQIVLIKDYVKNQNDSLSKSLNLKGINSTSKVWKFIEKYYPNEDHTTNKTWRNLNYQYKNYKDDSINVNKFLKKSIETFVKYKYDKQKINSIIDNATKNIKYPTTKTIVVEENKPETIVIVVDKEETEPVVTQEQTDKKTVTNNEEEKLITENKYLRNIIYSLLALISIVILFFTFKNFSKKMKKKKKKQEKKKLKKIKLTESKEEKLIIDRQENKEPIKDIFKKEKIAKSIISKNTELKTDTNWLLVHTSEIGKSHLVANPQIPCQDNHSILKMENGWGIAISCDGAGSAKLSHHGSEFIAKQSSDLFKDIIIQNNWITKNELPKQSDWELVCNKAMKKLRYDLGKLAEFKKIPVTDLACTIIVVIYSPIGLLSTHIGDGRAGFRDESGNWEAIISPHKGDEANQTIFITSDPWLVDNFTMSGVKVPESRVINKRPTAFTVMSDGFESHSFEMGYFDKEKQKFIELNRPFSKFFEQIIKIIKGMYAEEKSEKEIMDSWSSFVKQGTDKIKNEPDDKTIIIGVLKD